ncbi:MAG: glycosyltransferase family 4 protein, partial [Deltaproteobacteria bacterium]|nr:glycosyltransferase family 4 protein [Deltaproteobacteria bacterium]
ALPELMRRFPDITCLFVGDGPLLSFLKKRAADNGVFDICVFAGTHQRMDEIYPLMDIFVLPSLREPFGLVLLEAMACGIPVVATDAGGPPDFIKSGKNGILVPPADDSGALAAAVAELIKSPAMRGELSASARKMVAHEFDVSKTVSRIEGIYRSVARASRMEGK